MPSFKERSESELDRLHDEGLVAYLVAAREAGEAGALRIATAVLAFRFERSVRGRVRLKVDPDHVDDVVMSVFESLLPTVFRGGTIAEFRALLNKVTARRIADFHRGRESDPDLTPLVSGDDDWGVEPGTAGEQGIVEVQDVIDQAMGELSELHRQVVEEYVFLGFPAAEVAQRHEGMTEQNVHQIGSRFRKRLRELLEEAEGK